MPLILLIRHGENDYYKKGILAGRLPAVHLNETGRAQAQALADRLKDSAVKAVYSSPLERTMETAEPIARILNQHVIIRPGLIEIDLGDWQDQELKRLRQLKSWRIVQSAPALMRFPGGESFVDAQHRISREILNLVAGHKPDDMIVCVSHADPIKLAISFFIGLPLDLFQRLVVSPGSISILNIRMTCSNLIALNIEPNLLWVHKG